jgi:hypothetical protein
LCKSLGLKHCVQHSDHGDIYAGRITDILDLHLAQSFEELRMLYRTGERKSASTD